MIHTDKTAQFNNDSDMAHIAHGAPSDAIPAQGDNTRTFVKVSSDNQASLDVHANLKAALALANDVSLVGSVTQYADAYMSFDASAVVDGAVIAFCGRADANDMAGGLFRYYKNSNIAADDALIVIPTSGGGRLIRLGWTAYGFVGAVYPEWWGAKGDSISDDKPAFQAASDAIQAFPAGGTLTLSPGKRYAIGSLWTIHAKADKFFKIEGNGSVILNLPNYDGVLLYYGNEENFGGFPLIARDVVFRSSTENSTAIKLQWGGTSRFEACMFIGFRNGVVLDNSYAVSFVGSKFFNCTYAGIFAITHAHHLVINDCQFSNCVRSISAIAAMYNLRIINTDMEGGTNAIVLEAGGSSVAIDGCYIEAQSGQPIVFGNIVSAFSFQGNWLGENHALQQWTFIKSGVSNFNIFWNQPQLVYPGFSQGDSNSFVGTSNVTINVASSGSLLNGFTNYGNGYTPFGYTISGGRCHLQGMIMATTDSIAYIFPTGLRPVGKEQFIVTGTDAGPFGRVRIEPTGELVVYLAAGTASLSGISFLIGN